MASAKRCPHLIIIEGSLPLAYFRAPERRSEIAPLAKLDPAVYLCAVMHPIPARAPVEIPRRTKLGCRRRSPNLLIATIRHLASRDIRHRDEPERRWRSKGDDPKAKNEGMHYGNTHG